jgi:peptide/nickel transport system substrate-binding protein
MKHRWTVAAIGAAITLTAVPAQAQPKSNKGITVVLAVELDSLDPCDTQQAQNANVLRGNVYESLTRINPADGKVVPLLAESWSQPKDRTWVFKLKKGIKFHDGSDFTAKVAAANIQRTQVGAD